MTVDSLLSALGAEVAGNSQARQLQALTSKMFHNYAGIQQCVRDHTLQLDLSTQDLMNTQMYEELEPDSQKAMLSPCSLADSTNSQFDSFDLQPQFERSDDLLKYDTDLKGEFGQLEAADLTQTSNLLWSSLNCVDNLKMEDVFQMDKGCDGPTLNELNAVDSISLVGDDTMDHLLGSVDGTLLGQMEARFQMTMFSNVQPATSTSSVPAATSLAFSSAVSQSQTPLFPPAVPTPSTVTPSVGNITTPAPKLPLLLSSSKPAATVTSPQAQVAPAIYIEQKPLVQQQPTSTVTVAASAGSGHWAGLGLPGSGDGPRGIKRNASPTVEVVSGSVDRKWEEIKEYIHNDEIVAKKMKVERGR